jgi:hypothetical protein
MAFQKWPIFAIDRSICPKSRKAADSAAFPLLPAIQQAQTLL